MPAVPCPPVPALQANRYCNPHTAGRSTDRFIYSHPPLPMSQPFGLLDPQQRPIETPLEKKEVAFLTESLPIGDPQYIALRSPSVDLPTISPDKSIWLCLMFKASRCGDDGVLYTPFQS